MRRSLQGTSPAACAAESTWRVTVGQKVAVGGTAGVAVVVLAGIAVSAGGFVAEGTADANEMAAMVVVGISAGVCVVGEAVSTISNSDVGVSLLIDAAAANVGK